MAFHSWRTIAGRNRWIPAVSATVLQVSMPRLTRIFTTFSVSILIQPRMSHIAFVASWTYELPFQVTGKTFGEHDWHGLRRMRSSADGRQVDLCMAAWNANPNHRCWFLGFSGVTLFDVPTRADGVTAGLLLIRRERTFAIADPGSIRVRSHNRQISFLGMPREPTTIFAAITTAT